MAGQFLYYIPGGAPILKDDAFDEWARSGAVGLPQLAGGCLPQFRNVIDHGPDGASGTIIRAAFCEDDAVVPGYYPDKQAWHKCADGKFYLGYYPDAMPEPLDLARAELLPGYTETLEDGETWTVPTAKYLPRVFGLSPDGERVLNVAPQFADFCKTADEFFAAWMEALGNDADAEYPGAFDLAVESLSLNYHVGPYEMSALGVFSTQNVWNVCLDVIDWPTIREAAIAQSEAQKKTDDVDTPESSNGDSGERDASPDTSQRTATSG